MKEVKRTAANTPEWQGACNGNPCDCNDFGKNLLPLNLADPCPYWVIQWIPPGALADALMHRDHDGGTSFERTYRAACQTHGRGICLCPGTFSKQAVQEASYRPAPRRSCQ